MELHRAAAARDGYNDDNPRRGDRTMVTSDNAILQHESIDDQQVERETRT